MSENNIKNEKNTPVEDINFTFENLKTTSITDYLKNHSIPLLEKKPVLIADKVAYQWCEDNWLIQNKLHWIYDEISMRDDQQDWKKMDEASKHLLTKLFLFFTQIEVEVNQMYIRYMEVFQPFEVKKMLLKYAEVETMHAAGYKYLMANIFGDKANDMLHNFLDHKSMQDKYDALQQYQVKTVYDLCLTLIMFGGFSEGVLLYASFAIFLFFPHEQKKLNGTGQILSWSMRDESLHVHSMSLLYKELIHQLPDGFVDYLAPKVYEKAREMVELEFQFIDWIFGDAEIKNLEKAQLKKYIEFKANTRLLQFGFKPIYHSNHNPLHWMSSVGNVEFTNFFEGTVTEYSRVSAEDNENFDDNNVESLFN